MCGAGGAADNRCVEGNSGLARLARRSLVLVEPLDSSGAGRDASRDLGRFTGDGPTSSNQSDLAIGNR